MNMGTNLEYSMIEIEPTILPDLAGCCNDRATVDSMVN